RQLGQGKPANTLVQGVVHGVPVPDCHSVLLGQQVVRPNREVSEAARRQDCGREGHDRKGRRVEDPGVDDAVRILLSALGVDEVAPAVSNYWAAQINVKSPRLECWLNWRKRIAGVESRIEEIEPESSVHCAQSRFSNDLDPANTWLRELSRERV